ncbi:Nucleotidylyl transferase [Acephala macrosclerotiorum]|nr:Nucleotidylyl transferase [Acephala macrosclerotiorum]
MKSVISNIGGGGNSRGTAATGKPHCAYLVAAIKIARFLTTGCDVVVLLADIHGFLDNLKAPVELVEHRVEYYRLTISALLRAVGVSTQLNNLTIVQGSSCQKTARYVMDVYKLNSCISEDEAKRDGAEIVKQSDSAPLSGLLYLVTLFSKYSMNSTWTSTRSLVRAHLENGMVPGVNGGKMSSSDPVVNRKIRKATAAPTVIEDNGVLALTEFVLLPAAALSGRRGFCVDRDRYVLEPLIYTSIEKVHEDYKNDILTPQILKSAVAAALNMLFAPIQEAYHASLGW